MTHMDLWQHISDDIHSSTGVRVQAGHESIGGGCINQAVRLRGDGQDFFVKLNAANGLEMFIAEAEGLRELDTADAVRVPVPICHGQHAGQAYLVLEYLPFGGHGDAALLGRQLAAQHRVLRQQFGWRRDNTIGSTPQLNTWDADWIRFLRVQRLGYQLKLAAQNGCSSSLCRDGEQLLDSLPGFFTDYRPEPSLLHGDLWSGNHAYLADGTPTLFDPAVYFGDREADIAMTELFGGFGSGFLAGYNEAWPLDAGYAVRRTLYNLYHVLNHFNLFGGGYQSQAQGMIKRLLSELR